MVLVFGAVRRRGSITESQPITLAKTIEIAQPGTTICLMDGLYTDSFRITCSGRAGKPVTLQAQHYQSFKDCLFNNNAVNPNDFSEAYDSVVTPGNNWLIQDCRFTHCGTAMTISHSIFHRCNFLNYDPDWHGQGAKLGYTRDFVADGIIGYDNNGASLVNTMGELYSKLGVDANAASNDCSLDAGSYTVSATTLADVGNSSMWQVPSSAAENNNFNNAIEGKSAGSVVTLAD